MENADADVDVDASVDAKGSRHEARPAIFVKIVSNHNHKNENENENDVEDYYDDTCYMKLGRRFLRTKSTRIVFLCSCS